MENRIASQISSLAGVTSRSINQCCQLTTIGWSLDLSAERVVNSRIRYSIRVAFCSILLRESLPEAYDRP